jgi:hypothetical protein
MLVKSTGYPKPKKGPCLAENYYPRHLLKNNVSISLRPRLIRMVSVGVRLPNFLGQETIVPQTCPARSFAEAGQQKKQHIAVTVPIFL